MAQFDFDYSDDPQTLLHRLDMVGQMLADVLVAAGMIREDAVMTGPELLLAGSTYVECARDAKDTFTQRNLHFEHPIALIAGEPVERDDGRFYVPVLRRDARPGLSDTVLRVASDAFSALINATAFAQVVADAFNGLPGAETRMAEEAL